MPTWLSAESCVGVGGLPRAVPPCEKAFMHIDWNTLLCALGLAFVIESIPYVLFAERMRPVLRSLADQPPAMLRGMGIAAMCVGVLVVWLARRMLV